MKHTIEWNVFKRLANLSRAAGLLALLALPCLSTPAFAQVTCNPLTGISAVPPGPFLVPSATITINLDIGAGTIQGGSTMTIANVDYALDCENDGALPCIDDGDQMSYLGDATITTSCTDGMNPVTWSTAHPAGTVPNDITFVPSSPVVVGANSTCELDFDVQIVAPSDDLTPGLVEVAYGYPGVCDNTLTANAGGTAAFQTVVPSIAILKEISVDGGMTWFDANDPGSAPNVPFPSGALYRLTVENTGDVIIDNVVVNDATLGIMNFAVGTLTPGQIVVLTQAEIPALSVTERCNDSGEFENIAEVSGDPAVVNGGPVVDNDPAWLVCVGAPDIAILKEISIDGGTTWFDANDPGSAPVATFPIGALYRLTVENTGDITLENVVVNDPTLGIMDFPVGTLTPGQIVVLTQAEIPALSVTERCSEAGDFENTAEASGGVPGTPPVMDQDPAFLVCVGDPDIEILKEIFDEELGVFVDANDEATAPVVIAPSGALYRVTVTNTGTAPLDNVVVNDPTLGVVDFPVGTLAPGETVVLTEAEIPALSVVERCSGEGAFTNTADVAGTYLETQEEVTDSDPAVLVCEIEPLQFRVVKDFSDDNPAGVEVFLECNTGLPLQQQAVVHDPEASGLEPGDFTEIVFVVQDFEPGTMDCDIAEVIPVGYDPEYTAGATTGIAGNIFDDDEGCHYEAIESGEFTCSIFNDLEPVEVIVEKIWIDENPDFQQSLVVEVTLQCDGPIIGGYQCLNGEGVNGYYCQQQFIDPSNPGVFLVWPHFEGTFCFATEEPIVGVLTDESDCEEMIVFPGQGDRCVIINTRLYAGIPTLNQYGLMLLTLLMLGMGIIAFRRFA